MGKVGENQLKPVTFSVSGFTKRSTCLPPPTTNCKLQPDIHPKVPGLSAPFKSVPTGLTRPGLPPAPRLPQPRRSAAAGRGKGHFGAEWEPSKGDVSAWTLAATFAFLPPNSA